MDLATTAREWLPVLRGEYLESFIRDGGSAVKFAVCLDDAQRLELVAGLRQAAEEADYAFAALDAANVKVHMVDKMFHAVARSVDWDSMARSFVLRLLRDKGYIVPSEGQALDLDSLAALNGLPVPEMGVHINQALQQELYHDYSMAQEFRIAMMRLCMAVLRPQELSLVTADTVKRWLHGDLPRITALKEALIFQQIARHNARHMLISLAHWRTRTDGAGLVIAIDTARLFQSRPPMQRDDPLYYSYYSTPAVLDAYEVLRQFVDATDEMSHTLIVVVAPSAVLAPAEESPRSVQNYRALWSRIVDEVTDARRVNPLAGLVRLDSGRVAAPVGG